MATYKVIQDIEAEDKLLGPLTLRQFIYAGVAAVSLYLCFYVYTRGATFMIAIFLPIAMGAGFFGFPWKGEQPTEIWALARLRFSILPRVRIWDQDGAKDLVTITAPKKVEVRQPAKARMSQQEVKSRLKALADTIDSRGWATRNAAYGIQQNWAHPTVAPVPAAYDHMAAFIPNDDMFSEQNSVSQNFDAMLTRSGEQQRQRILDQIQQAQAPTPVEQYYSQTSQPVGPAAMTSSQIIAPTQPQAQQQPPQPQPAAPAQTMQVYQMPSLPAPVMPPDAPQMGFQPGVMPVAPSQVGSFGPDTGLQSPSLPAPVPPADSNWFANGPAYPAMPQPMVMAPNPAPVDSGSNFIESDVPLMVAPNPTAEEQAVADDIMQKNRAAQSINYGHMRVLQPLGGDGASVQSTPIDRAATEPVTPEPNPAILELANNDDLDIATIARQASREIDKSPDEVEIRLH